MFNLALLVSVLLRRYLKQRFFAQQDENRFRWARPVEEVLAGRQAVETVDRPHALSDRKAAEESLLQRWTTVSPPQQALLKSLFEHWGLLEWRLRRLRRGNKRTRIHSALVLGRLGYREVLPDLRALLRNGKADAQLAAINALELLGAPEAISPLVDYLAAGGAQRTRPVLSALIHCGERNPKFLLEHLKHPEKLVRTLVASALADVATVSEIPALLSAAADSEPEVRAKVARALGRTGNRGTTPLKQLAHDPVWFVRLQAIGSLAQLHLADTADLFWKAVQDKHWQVREKALLALDTLYSDPTELLRQMRTVPDRYAQSGLISILERKGLVWKAINDLGSPDPETQQSSQILLAELLELKAFATTFYALETHPEAHVRRELLRLASEHSSPAMRPALLNLLESFTTSTETRRGAEALLTRLEANR